MSNTTSFVIIYENPEDESQACILERIDFNITNYDVEEGIETDYVTIGGKTNTTFEDLSQDDTLILYDAAREYTMTCHESRGYDKLSDEGFLVMIIGNEMADNIPNNINDQSIRDKYEKFGFMSSLPVENQNPTGINILATKDFRFSEPSSIGSTLNLKAENNKNESSVVTNKRANMLKP